MEGELDEHAAKCRAHGNRAGIALHLSRISGYNWPQSSANIEAIMEKPNAYQLPSDPVTVYLDRYTAKRLLLALTQALEPGQDYYKKKSKKGKGGGYMKGMKLSKKGKGAPYYGLKMTKSHPTYGLKMSKSHHPGRYRKVVLRIPAAPPMSPTGY
jgi:hypothetical protein